MENYVKEEEKDDMSRTWEEVEEEEGEEEWEDDKSEERLLKICFMPSATPTAGLDLNLRQKSMWALTAS